MPTNSTIKGLIFPTCTSVWDYLPHSDSLESVGSRGFSRTGFSTLNLVSPLIVISCFLLQRFVYTRLWPRGERLERNEFPSERRGERESERREVVASV